MTLSVRARVRNALFAASSLLAVAGVVVVANLQAPANNLDLDCTYAGGVDGGVLGARGRCRAVLEPNANAPPEQCAALMGTGGEPPGIGQDAGLPNARVRVERALEAMRNNDVIDGWHCEAAIIDAGPQCWCEITGSVSVSAGGKVDGQAPGWRDAFDAAGAGSILKPGRVSARPAYALRGGCRAHVLFGEDPCAGSRGLDGGPEPDGGP